MKENISKKIKLSMLILNIILIIAITLIFLFKESLFTLIYPISVSFFMFLSFFSIILFGYRKNKKNFYKDHTLNMTILISTIYLILIYFIGNFTGYTKNENIIINSLYLILIIIFMELYRYNILNKCSKKTNQQYIITCIYILFEILVLSSYGINQYLPLPNVISLVLVATIKQGVLSYTSSKFGYHPCIVYSFITTLMPLAAPIYPDLGSYLNIIFTIIYSSIIMYNATRPIHKEDEEKYNKNQKGFIYYFERALLVIIIFIIFLVSGNFKYSISAIASDSMYPELKRGDAIVLERVTDKNRDSIEKGMIVSFEENHQIITHRVLSIIEENGVEYLVTKGDNNPTKDVTNKKKDDIIGIVRFRIPLLGYPSVEISEIKTKED